MGVGGSILVFYYLNFFYLSVKCILVVQIVSINFYYSVHQVEFIDTCHSESVSAASCHDVDARELGASNQSVPCRTAAENAWCQKVTL